ncbi:MAG: glycosyltransferase family 9 protein [Armatimonadota bacterium]|nr:glycosyltransferase family 9 protein [Armatimonadota bacterium]
MSRPLPALTDISRLLIVKTSSIGDVIHALPIVQAIKEAAPHLTLGWVVRRRCADVLRGNPVIDHLYVMPDKPSLGELRALRGELRAGRYEMALDMQGLLLSGLVTWLSGAPVRLGWDRNREANALFLTHPIIPGKGQMRHEVDLLYGFAEMLGVQTAHADFTPQPYLASEGLVRAEEWLAALLQPRIALNVGASRAYKRWPVERWAQVAQALTAQGRGVVFVGDKNDAEIVAQITPSLTAGYVDLAGKTTLRELASVLAACDLLVTADTGPMHIAVAVGTPVIAIFGATDPARHGPYGARNVVLHDPAPGAMMRGKRPTEEAGTACMARVTVEDVLRAVERLLSGKLYHDA